MNRKQYEIYNKLASYIPHTTHITNWYTKININNIKEKNKNLLLYCKGKNCEWVDWKRQWHLYRDHENS